MTNKEALDWLIYKISIDVQNSRDVPKDIECLEMCKKALEKQIPKKPYKISNEIYHCVVCSAPVRLGDVWDDNFCDVCGQAIDWSEE